MALLTLINRAVFWFHPLAWWLRRRIATLSEQACDAVVVSGGHDAERSPRCCFASHGPSRRPVAGLPRLLSGWPASASRRAWISSMPQATRPASRPQRASRALL